MKIAANVSTYAPHARFIFLTGKNMAALSEPVLQMVMYLHTGSHVKPRRVKTHMQMRADKKEDGSEMVPGGEVKWKVFSLFLRWFFLLQTRIGLRRNGGQFKETERRELSNMERWFWLVIAGFCSWETQWQLYQAQAILAYSITPARWISLNWGWSPNLTARPRAHLSLSGLRRLNGPANYLE